MERITGKCMRETEKERERETETERDRERQRETKREAERDRERGCARGSERDVSCAFFSCIFLYDVSHVSHPFSILVYC